MNKKAYAFSLKKNRRKNPIAKALKFFTPKNRRKNPIAKALKFFTPKVIKDKTKYNRKQDDQVWKKQFWKSL